MDSKSNALVHTHRHYTILAAMTELDGGVCNFHFNINSDIDFSFYFILCLCLVCTAVFVANSFYCGCTCIYKVLEFYSFGEKAFELQILFRQFTF